MFHILYISVHVDYILGVVMSEEKIINIRENPNFNYSHVVDKICRREEPFITKLARKRHFPNGIYRLRRELSNHHGKLLDEHIEITSSTRILWVKLTNEQARDILGTNNKPMSNSYLQDLRLYWSHSDMAFSNSPYMNIHEIEYIKRPIQRTLI